MTTLTHTVATRLRVPPPLRAWVDEHSLAMRLTAVITAIVVAYHYSLLTLVRSLSLDTPLAYLGLVPLMALGLAGLRARPQPNEPAIHDRQVDYIVGLPLVVSAALIVMLLPARLSTLFWVWRVDLISLPLFVAGVVTLVFGVRALWRLRIAILFLLLAWPLPYTAFMERWLEGFTGITIAALKQAVGVWHVAAPAAGSDGSLFAMVHNGERIVVSVASSCSGVNGMVGFLLVGIAFTTLVQGRRLPKLLWLVGGLLLIWSLNLLRLMLLFWAGSRFGEKVAIDGLHPFIGLVLFCLGIVVMILTMPLFRLTMSVEPRPKKATAAALPDVEAPRPTPVHRVAVPRVRGALAILLAGTVFMGVANAGMRNYELVAGDLGAARLTAFADTPAAIPDFMVTPSASYPWARRFFGSKSTWLRYTYSGTAAGTFGAPITADVVTTNELRRFSDYGIEACYKFHGYKVKSPRGIDLGGGITGTVLTYENPKQKMMWNVVYWMWPVRTAEGRRFERVVLLVPGRSQVSSYAGPAPRTDLVRGIGIDTYNASRGFGGGKVEAQINAGREFLVGFARGLVKGRQPAPATSRG